MARPKKAKKEVSKVNFIIKHINQLMKDLKKELRAKLKVKKVK